MIWQAGSGRNLTLKLTLADAQSGMHQGECDTDIAALRALPRIARQLVKWDTALVRAELEEYGAWDAEELADDETNLDRMLWIACGDIVEEAWERKRRAS